MHACIKALKIKLELRNAQLESQNFIHFLCLKSRSIISNQKGQDYSKKILLLEYEFEERFQDFNNIKWDFTLFAPSFTMNINNSPENLQIELNRTFFFLIFYYD